MSFLTDASLVFIPSGYKEDKAYSIKPTDGSGDLTFARASDGTRVNSDGYIERVPWNLLQQSNTLNTTWTLGGSTISGGHTGYDGSSNAWLLSSTNTSQSYCRQTITQSGKLSFSAYAKKGTANYIVLYCVGGGDARAFFNLANGTIGTQNFNLSSSIEDVGNGWYKCSLYFDKTISDVRFYVADSDNNFNSANGSNVYIQDAQLNEGTLKPYFPTTNRQDVPRLDYSNGCPCLLLEPQRTNLVTYDTPSNFSASVPRWTNGTSNPAVINQAVGIYGTETATKYTKTAGNTTADYLYFQQVPVVSGSVYTVSGYIKLGTASNAVVVINNSTAWDSVIGANFVATASGGYDQWKRFEITFTAPASNKINIHFGYHMETGVAAQADGTFFIQGVQLELGSYATSIIQTNGTSVTRVADAASKTGISDLIGQTEGTLFADFVFDGLGTEQRLGISDGTSANYNNIRITTGGTLYVLGAASSVLQYEINCASLSIGNRYKVALAYKQNDIIVYLNGSNVGSDNSATIGACSRFGFDNRDATSVPFRSPINQAVLFKTRLTNTELAALTTL